MNKAKWHRWMVGVVSAALSLAGAAAEPPGFQEVYQLIRSNLVGLTESELNAAAIAGLLQQLHSQVVLVTNSAPASAGAPTPGTAPVRRVFDRSFAYVRIGEIESGAADAFGVTLGSLAGSNRIEGLVLDLRFARGTDYAEAGRIADRFLATDRPLVEWAEVKLRSTAKTNAVSWPTAVLINGETTGAAEALAGVLRQTDVGLLIGAGTSGRASLQKEFPLAGGSSLRIAYAPVSVAGGGEIPRAGLKPDIAVDSKLDDERLFLDDPYRATVPAPGALRRGTNGLANATNRQVRVNEADLVRMKRQGFNLDDGDPRVPPRPTPAEAPVVTDPVLSRALDLLKGLAVFRPHRES